MPSKESIVNHLPLSTDNRMVSEVTGGPHIMYTLSNVRPICPVSCVVLFSRQSDSVRTAFFSGLTVISRCIIGHKRQSH